jgi:penicillin-binding protein 1A
MALIAGLAQAPGRADPYKDRAAARARRDEVLERMARAGFITEAEAAGARARDIELLPPPQRYGALAPWHTERVRREIAEAMPEAYERGGLRIETAALPVLSMAAEAEARRWAERLGKGDDSQESPQVGALVWDHGTGYIEATVGGLSWQHSQFDRATQACRQPGSAFKPIVYAAAVESDAITPGTALRDAPIAEYDEDLDVYWKPSNSGRSFRGVVLAQDALALSLNAPAVDVFDRVGSARVIDLSRRLGLTTDLADVRPLVLGASCVIPLELAGAYAVFARQGMPIEPIFTVRVQRVDDPLRGPRDDVGGPYGDVAGDVLVDRASPWDPALAPARRLDRLVHAVVPGEPVMDGPSAYLISAMLADVVARGTATAARRLARPAAGKTGTTNENTDAWFVGYTGRVIAAVWIGYDDPAHTLAAGQDGSHAALPLWMRMIELAEGARAPVAVPGEAPSDLVRVRVDRETGFLAQPGAGGAVELYLKRGTEPTERAGHSPGVPVDLGRAARQF